MAKRVAPDDKPYRPVEDALVRSVLNPQLAVLPGPAESLPTDEPQRPQSAQPRLASVPGRKPEAPSKPEPDKAPELERLTREKRVLLTLSEEREVERLVSDMAEALGTPLKSSHVLRAMVTLLCHAKDELVKQSRKAGPWKRPPNGDAAALATFEHNLSQLLHVSLRNTRQLE
jgi:hypothetical protein